MTEQIKFSDLTFHVEDINGWKVERWLYKGRMHSVDDRPSMIIKDGVELRWHKMGDPHRDGDKPAIYNTLTEKQSFYKHGVLHNHKGPAKVFPDGSVEWWWEGIYCQNIKDWLQLNTSDCEEVVMLKLKYT